MLSTIINTIQTSTGLTVYPLSVDSTEDAIIYVHNIISDDGAVSKHRLELRIITHSIADVEDYRKQIVQALVTTGDNAKIDGIYQCSVNGGGQLQDKGTHTVHTILYLEYITRSYT